MSVILEMTNDVQRVRELLAQGSCPVECSIDGQSLVDELEMDHHGERSHLDSVAVRALDRHAGVRRHDPRFVGVGEADADMTFAVAALAGLLPVERPLVQQLARLVAQVDTRPLAVDLSTHPQGDLLLLWYGLAGGARETQGATAAVWMWHHLLSRPSEDWAPLLQQARAREVVRRAQARDAMERHGHHLGPILALEDAPGWGFDVWYGRRPQHSPQSPRGWHSPVVLWRQANHGQIMIGCPNEAVAKELFGPRGLGEIFDALPPKGWGGRASVGGSPRGQPMSAAQLHQAARCVARLCNKPR